MGILSLAAPFRSIRVVITVLPLEYSEWRSLQDKLIVNVIGRITRRSARSLRAERGNQLYAFSGNVLLSGFESRCGVLPLEATRASDQVL
jgi:hypothetical protein